MKVLITGSNGFVGRHLVDYLHANFPYTIVQGTRKGLCDGGKGECLKVDFSNDFDLLNSLTRVDVIVHCAARVHLMSDSAKDPLTEYRQINTEGTLKLARQAAEAGVKRFIFISTIKVNGEFSTINQPFVPHVKKAPHDPYGLSKYEAEKGLLALAHETGMEVVIIRPPLVYGKGVKANFNTMVNIVRKGLPLPLGGIDNKRSLVYVGNLVDLVTACLEHPGASNRVFLVSDDEDVSTSQLLRKIATAMGKNSYLLPIPGKLILWLTKALGKASVGDRLCSSLQVDISETKSCLNWKPPYCLDDALKLTVTNKK